MEGMTGRWGRMITSACVVVYTFGTTITFLIVIGDQFDATFHSIYGDDFTNKVRKVSELFLGGGFLHKYSNCLPVETIVSVFFLNFSGTCNEALQHPYVPAFSSYRCATLEESIFCVYPVPWEFLQYFTSLDCLFMNIIPEITYQGQSKPTHQVGRTCS